MFRGERLGRAGSRTLAQRGRHPFGKTTWFVAQSTTYRNISEPKRLVLTTGDSPSFRLPKIGSKNPGRPAAAVNGAAGFCRCTIDRLLDRTNLCFRISCCLARDF